jgi:phage shock protein C
MAIYCRQCGSTIAEGARFCSACGTEVATAAYVPQPVARQLVRPRAGRMIAGVCQGIANQYAWDVAWVRVLAVLLALFSGVGLIAYLVLWVVTPEEPLSLPSGQTYTPNS